MRPPKWLAPGQLSATSTETTRATYWRNADHRAFHAEGAPHRSLSGSRLALRACMLLADAALELYAIKARSQPSEPIGARERFAAVQRIALQSVLFHADSR